MLYLVSGKEDFLREEFVGQLKTLMRKLPMGEHNIDELGPDTAVREVIAACDTVPFLCEKRMVIARGVLSGVPRARGARRTRGAGSAVADTPAGVLAAYVPNLPASTHLVLVEDDPAVVQPLAGSRPDAVRRVFTPLRDDALPRWIEERAAKYAARVSPRAAAELAQVVGSDLRRLDAEVAKLACYVEPGATIEVHDVHALVVGAGPDIFALHDAVAERRPAGALATAHALMERGGDPSEMLAQLAALVRRLLVIKELTADRRPVAREAPSYGLGSSPYLLQKLQRQVARLRASDLVEAFRVLRDADFAIKTGRMHPELAVELAIAAILGAAPLQDAPPT